MKVWNAVYTGLAIAGSLSCAAAVEKKDLASEIWADIESATTCAACDVSAGHSMHVFLFLALFYLLSALLVFVFCFYRCIE
jgi:hypothetical protein